VVLSRTPGEYVAQDDVYFTDNRADVNSAGGGDAVIV
jgi:hypothetical protein